MTPSPDDPSATRVEDIRVSETIVVKVEIRSCLTLYVSRVLYKDILRPNALNKAYLILFIEQ